MYRQAFRFLQECQGVAFRVVIHMDTIAPAYLIGRNQIGHGLNEQPFDGALQMTGAVLEICSFP